MKSSSSCGKPLIEAEGWPLVRYIFSSFLVIISLALRNNFARHGRVNRLTTHRGWTGPSYAIKERETNAYTKIMSRGANSAVSAPGGNPRERRPALHSRKKTASLSSRERDWRVEMAIA